MELAQPQVVGVRNSVTLQAELLLQARRWKSEAQQLDRKEKGETRWPGAWVGERASLEISTRTWLVAHYDRSGSG